MSGNTRKVGLVGAGLIGRGWAILFAKAGYEVALYDAQAGGAESALEFTEASLREHEEMGLVDSAVELQRRLRAADSLAETLDGACYVQESVSEIREIKNQVFLEMDALADPDTILASSCSTIPPATFLEDVPGRQRCLIAHPFNPPHLIPIVEIVPSPWTSEATRSRCWELMEELGQAPIHIRKPVTGFAVCRLQAAVINEAMHLVDEGVISPRDLDRCMKDGLGLRWAFLGPFETMELNAPGGFRDYATKFGHVYREMGKDLGTSRSWTAAAIEQVEAWRRSELDLEEVPRRQAWRDHNLMRLAKLFREPGDA